MDKQSVAEEYEWAVHEADKTERFLHRDLGMPSFKSLSRPN